jgi:hypothetical protein
MQAHTVTDKLFFDGAFGKGGEQCAHWLGNVA